MPKTANGGFEYSTIGDYLDEPDFTHSVYCEGGGGWHNGADIDIEKLVERLGRDHPCSAMALKPYFRCSRCGSKEVSFRLRHNGRPRGSVR